MCVGENQGYHGAQLNGHPVRKVLRKRIDIEVKFIGDHYLRTIAMVLEIAVSRREERQENVLKQDKA